MRLILFLAVVLPNFMGCNTVEDPEYSPLTGKLCTLRGGVTSIKVDITSPKPLPQNLAIALNGKGIDFDECTPSEYGVPNSMQTSYDRTHATIYFYPFNSPEDFKIYFPEGYGEPISNVIDLIFYSRANCTDLRTQFQEISDNNGITWKPGYANGEDCGVTGYTGEYQIDL